MARKSITVLGREKLRSVLKKLPQAVRTELQSSLTKSAEIVASAQRSLVPVKDGILRDSIRVEPFSRGGIGVLIKAGGPTTTKPVRVGQTATYDYAMGQELGTQEMVANPFFYPAYRMKKSGVKSRATRAVKKAVEKTAKGG